MARKSNGFVSVLIPLVVLTLVIFSGGPLKRAGQNIYIFFHPGSSFAARSNSIYGSDVYAHPVVKKLLTKSEGTKDFTVKPVTSRLKPNMSGSINGITYEENRVLYKVYKATQEPNFECVIRFLKYRRPKAEEVLMNNDIWARSKCEGMPCDVETRYSLNLRDFRDTDAVVLMPGALESYNWKLLLRARPPGQLWILYTRESPIHDPQFAPPADVYSGNPYNLSMAYRSGSDIDLSYGRFVPGGQTARKLRAKSKLMMWMASRCDPLGWERTKLVHEIQKHLDVDIYGKCGPLECPKHNWDSCLELMQQYKFYLALENSECREYMTEKFWSNAYTTGMVPIVFGAAKEDYVRVAPPNSFIHLNDFNTMQEFVDYIKLLDQNDTLYRKYFDWKKQGRVAMGSGFRSSLSLQSQCKLTKMLVEISLYPENSWRGRTPDFAKWWAPTCSHQQELLGVKI